MVEHRLAKARVASSNLVFRSILPSGGPARPPFHSEALPLPATLKVLDPTQVELEIAVSNDEFAQAQDVVFKRLVKNARFPGFRPGKVPRKIFEAQYGGSLRAEALDDAMDRAYKAALAEHAVRPLAAPQTELLDNEDGAAIRFKAVVPVIPQIELRDYQGIALQGERDHAQESDVEEAIATLRRDAATLVPADRPVALGDVATIDYEGKVDGVPFEGGTAKGEQADITPGRFIPGFVEGIVGMTAGETRDIDVTFPENYGNADLAGKAAVFTIAVHEIKEPELPAVDDEFAQKVSKNADLAALRADIRVRLDEVASRKARQALVDRLLEKLVEMHEIPLPAILVDAEVDGLLGESRGYVERYGTTWDEYLATGGRTEESFREELRPEAERRVKTTLLIQAIARAEKVEASREEIEAELDTLSQQYGQPREKILELMGANFSALVDGIVRTKTIDRILESAKVAEPEAKVADDANNATPGESQ